MKDWLGKILKKRAQKNFSYIADFIRGENILEIGAAEGWNGALAKAADSNRHVELLDVVDMNKTDLSLTLYNGRDIPFADGRFDTTLILLALHHCTDPDAVLREAVRVTKGRIIITESVYRNMGGRAVLWFLDNLLNGVRSGHLMPEGLYFRTEVEWNKTFSEYGLHLQKKQWISKGLHKHILFVLDK